MAAVFRALLRQLLPAIVGYLFLLLTVRVLARRPGEQPTLFEFVIVLLIGGVVILATVGNDRPLTNCSTAILTVALIHRLVSWARSHSPRVGGIVDGTPFVLGKNGQWESTIMRRTHIDPKDTMAATRNKGINAIVSVHCAILERNGTISIIQNEDTAENDASPTRKQ